MWYASPLMPYPAISARIGAPRRRACSSSSRIRIPAPSPITKPSRSLSHGRLARVGSSLRVERARIAAKPPTPIGVMAASEPPAIITSASLCWMIRKESPTECALVVQAVAVASFGPFAPNRIDTCPAARLMMDAGIKKGEILRGPPSMSAVCSRSITSNPPMPDPICTPTRSSFSGVICNCDIFIASSDAASARWMNRPIFLISFFSMNFSGSKDLTSAAIWQAKAEASNPVMRATPLLPASNAGHTSAVVLPTAQIIPKPVMTTRRAKLLACLRMFADVIDRIRYGANLLGVFVRNLDVERLFERHDQFHGVQRVGSQVVHERSARRNLALVHTQLFHNNLLHFFVNGCHRSPRFQVWGLNARVTSTGASLNHCRVPLKIRNGTGFNSLKGIAKVCKDLRTVLGSQFSVVDCKRFY